jgi:hypothetical protein
MHKRNLLTLHLLLITTATLFAQQPVAERDSVRLQVLPNGDILLLTPQTSSEKPWLDIDESLPTRPGLPKATPRLTLHPYTANTRYDWDPVYQKKIVINKDTWRSDPFYHIYGKPMKLSDEDDKETVVLVTSNRGSTTGFTGGGTVFTGDLLYYFTKEFWSFRLRRNRARTLQVLKDYMQHKPEPESLPEPKAEK